MTGADIAIVASGAAMVLVFVAMIFALRRGA